MKTVKFEIHDYVQTHFSSGVQPEDLLELRRMNGIERLRERIRQRLLEKKYSIRKVA